MQHALFWMKYEQICFVFEKVFTVLFSNEVSSATDNPKRLQSVYHSGISRSLVRIHDCNQIGECKASATGTITTDKSSGKWTSAVLV